MTILLITVAVLLAIPIVLFIFSIIFFTFLDRSSRRVQMGTPRISGQILDHSGTVGQSGVMIWARYGAPSAPFSRGQIYIYGPYFTGTDGCFEIPPDPEVLRTAGLMLDSGPTEPTLFIIHPTDGMNMTGIGMTPSAFTHRWLPSDDIAYAYRAIDLMPSSVQETVRNYIEQSRSPRETVAQQSVPGGALPLGGSAPEPMR